MKPNNMNTNLDKFLSEEKHGHVCIQTYMKNHKSIGFDYERNSRIKALRNMLLSI